MFKKRDNDLSIIMEEAFTNTRMLKYSLIKDNPWLSVKVIEVKNVKVT